MKLCDSFVVYTAQMVLSSTTAVLHKKQERILFNKNQKISEHRKFTFN